jgi:hypothetical protein
MPLVLGAASIPVWLWLWLSGSKPGKERAQED